MPEETADGEMAFHRTGLNSARNNTVPGDVLNQPVSVE
jgi:hypothetical protein